MSRKVQTIAEIRKVPEGPLRILHAPIMVLYQPWLYTRALRKLGHTADYMIWDAQNTEIFGHGFDINLKIQDSDNLTTRARGHRSRSQQILLDFLHQSIDKYDIFHFHSGYSMIPRGYIPGLEEDYDLKLLRRHGKRIVFQYWGCDIRLRNIDQRHQYSPCRVCNLPCQNTRKLQRNLRALMYCDLRLAGGPDSLESAPDCAILPNATDLEFWRPDEPIPPQHRLPAPQGDEMPIRVFHAFGNAPNRGDIKGTMAIRQAVDALRAEGLPVEFIYFENVPNREMKYYQLQADIVVDQLYAGWYGSLAIECMALGKPVIGYIRPDYQGFYGHEIPVLQADVETVKDRISRLARDPELRREAGRRSREYVEKVHDADLVGKKLADYYRGIYEYDRQFFWE